MSEEKLKSPFITLDIKELAQIMNDCLLLKDIATYLSDLIINKLKEQQPELHGKIEKVQQELLKIRKNKLN